LQIIAVCDDIYILIVVVVVVFAVVVIRGEGRVKRRHFLPLCYT
jgi:hypothetical protein